MKRETCPLIQCRLPTDPFLDFLQVSNASHPQGVDGVGTSGAVGREASHLMHESCHIKNTQINVALSLMSRTHLKAMGCLNPGGHRGFPLSSTAQQTLKLISPDVSRMPASGREGWGSPPAMNTITTSWYNIEIPYLFFHSLNVKLGRSMWRGKGAAPGQIHGLETAN